MRKALALARKGAGQASPNPMVGAVVVKAGTIVARGYHVWDRKDHAEVIALAQAGNSSQGADLYVTLEPCAHQGRTPPCIDRILASKIRRVFVAVEDANPLVKGKGIAFLRDRGLEVNVGLCREAALKLNAPFFHFIRTQKPFVTLKLAMTLDGRIATRSGESKWITGPQARSYVQRMRFESDAILVGSGTISKDDPSLNVRWRLKKPITKVVLDSRLQVPPGSRLFESDDPVILFHSSSISQSAKEGLARMAELIGVSKADGFLRWDEILSALGKKRINSLMVEGGSRVAGTLLACGLANRLVFFYGARLIGSTGLPAIGELRVDKLDLAPSYEIERIKRLGKDFVVEAFPV